MGLYGLFQNGTDAESSHRPTTFVTVVTFVTLGV